MTLLLNFGRLAYVLQKLSIPHFLLCSPIFDLVVGSPLHEMVEGLHEGAADAVAIPRQSSPQTRPETRSPAA
jgi:hypothetical protein